MTRSCMDHHLLSLIECYDMKVYKIWHKNTHNEVL